MSSVFNAEGFIGGVHNLDGMDGADLVDGMKTVVFSLDSFAPYVLDDGVGGAENSPLKITPDINPGNKRWLLMGGVFAGLSVYGAVQIDSGSGNVAMALISADADSVLTFSDNSASNPPPFIGGRGDSVIIGRSSLVRAEFKDDGTAILTGSLEVNGAQRVVRLTGTTYVGLELNGPAGGDSSLYFLEDTVEKAFIGWDASETEIRFSNGGVRLRIGSDGGIHMSGVKSGTDQANAGAAVGELYFDTNDDNTVKMGV